MQKYRLQAMAIMLGLLVCSGSHWAQARSLSQHPHLPAAHTAITRFSAQIGPDHTVEVQWDITPDAFLYRDKTCFAVIQPTGVALGRIILPQGQWHYDTLQGKTAVWSKQVRIRIPFLHASPDARVVFAAHTQGCSQQGYCYPPLQYQVIANFQSGQVSIAPMPASPRSDRLDEADLHDPVPLNKETTAATQATRPPSALQKALHLLRDANPLWRIISFFFFGLLLAFTPCILPMIPVLFSIIVGQNPKHMPRYKPLLLAIVYTVSMASTYATLGLCVSLIGVNLQPVFQHPLFLLLFATLLVAMACSLWGVYTLPLPARFQAALHRRSARYQGGSYWQVAIMGCLATLMLSPCVTPPLVAALTYILHSGDVVRGSMALWMLGMGMGTPLIALGAVGHRIIPQTGPWMRYINKLLGVILLVIAASLVTRITGTIPGNSKHSMISPTAATHAHTLFTLVETPAELVQQLTQARIQHQPVMVFFSANWCITCHHIDQFVLGDPAVKTALRPFLLLRVDLTDSTTAKQRLQSQYEVFAPPTLLFFSPQGQWLKQATAVGALTPTHFLQLLKSWYTLPQAASRE